MPKRPPGVPKAPDPDRRQARASVSLGYWAEQVLSPDNVSASLEAMARRHHQFMLAATPRDWSIGDWAVLALALKEGAGQADYDAWRPVLGWSHAYREWCQLMYQVDPVEVARKLQEAGELANIAVCARVDRYWAVKGTPSHAERLEAIGLASRADVESWEADEARRKDVLERERLRLAAEAAARPATKRRVTRRKASPATSRPKA